MRPSENVSNDSISRSVAGSIVAKMLTLTFL
jgi:hypothetical protein